MTEPEKPAEISATASAPPRSSADLFAACLSDIAVHGNTRRAVRENAWDLKAFYAYLHADAEDARKRYVCAKELGIETLADEMIELADESRIGTKTRETKDGTFDETGDMVDRTRLQIDVRKFLLAKILPKKYGDKLDVDVQGNLTVNIAAKDASVL